MIETVVSAVASFFLAGVAAAFSQNLLLTRALGTDLLGRMQEDGDVRIFCALQGACALPAAVGFWLVNRFVLPHLGFLQRFGVSAYYARAFLWPLFMALVLAGVFFAVFVACIKLAPYGEVLAAVRQLPFAAFNTFVAGMLMLSASKDYTFWQTLALALGSSIGYDAVCFLLLQARRKLQNRDMPAAFRGMPASLLYLSGLALAAWALIGHGFSDLL